VSKSPNEDKSDGLTSGEKYTTVDKRLKESQMPTETIKSQQVSQKRSPQIKQKKMMIN
jgi:hypothetical protein